MIVVGVDPGAVATGIAVLAPRRELLASATIERARYVGDDLLVPDPRYLAEIVAAIRDACRTHSPEVVAVELVSRPRQHLNGARARGGNGGAAADPTALLSTASVIGAVAGRSWTPAELVYVPPGGNGGAPVGAYPAELRGPREALDRPGTGRLRHERSAYDVALSGARLAALARVRR